MKYLFFAILFFCSTLIHSQKWEEINALAVEAHDKGEYEKAKIYYEEGLILAKKEYGAKSSSYSSALNNYALLLANLGEYEKAETLYFQALGIRKKVFGENHKKYAFTLNCLGTLYQIMGKYPLAEEYYLRSLTIDSISGGTSSEDYASDLSNLGLLYQNMGKYDMAEQCLTHSLFIRKKLFGENDEGYVVSLSNLALLYLVLGRYEESEKMFLEVWDKNKKSLGENHPDCGTDLNNLASLYSEIGEMEKSEFFFLEAMKVWKNSVGEMSQQYASLLNNLANLYDDMGDLERSEELYLKCKEIGEKVWGEKHPEYASCLNNLATLYLDMGRNEEAEDLFIKAALIRQEVLGTDHPDFAASLNSLGIIYYERDNYEDAETYYIKALGIFIDNYGQSHPFVGKILLNLGLLYTTTSQFDKAEDLYLVSSNIIKESSGENSYSYAASIWGIARMYRVMGRYEESEKFYLKADTVFKNVLGEATHDYAIVIQGLGCLKWEMGDTLTAGKYFEKSDSIFLLCLQKIFRFTSENEKINGLMDVKPYFEKSQSFYHASTKNRTVSSTDALNLHLATSGLVLSSVSVLRGKIFSEGGDSVQFLYGEWERYNKLIATELSKPVSDRSEKLSEWENESNNLEKKLNKLSNTFKSTISAPTPDFVQLRSSLKPDEAAVEFISFDYKDGSELNDSTVYAAIVVTSDCEQPFYVHLFHEKQLAGLLAGDSLRTFANLLYSEAVVRNVDHDISYGDSLYQLVWKPIEQFLKNKTHIYYSPAGLLHTINFDAVPVNPTQVLSDKHTMHRSTTTAQLIGRTKETFQLNSVVLYGGIQYEIEENELKKLAKDNNPETNNSFADLRSTEDSKTRSGFNYLPGSLTEVEKIRDITKNKGINTTLYVGITGNEESVKSLTGINSPSIIHFSTHGFFIQVPTNQTSSSSEYIVGKESVFTSSDDPLFRSGLIMAGADHVWKGNDPIPGLEDGILTAYEVSNMYLPNTELVVMSACETGLGDIKGSEGVYGLQRAFKMAGVDYIIVSLWQVLDKETSDFMILFYQNLSSMKSIPDAFKATQDSMKNKYRDEPYKWAGFVLIK